MKGKALIMAALLGMAVSFGASAQNAEKEHNSYVEVTGFAEQEVEPDVFYMRIVINEQDSKGKNSLDNQEKAMIKALRKIGINTDKRLTRLSLSSSFYKKKTNFAVGTYQLKLDGAELVSKTLSVLDGQGISDVAFTKAEYSRMDSLKNEVRARAAKNAKEQAETIAEALGQKLGKCFYIYAGQGGNAVLYAQPRMTKAMMLDTSNEIGFTEEESIEFNSIKVTMNVNAKFVLE